MNIFIDVCTNNIIMLDNCKVEKDINSFINEFGHLNILNKELLDYELIGERNEIIIDHDFEELNLSKINCKSIIYMYQKDISKHKLPIKLDKLEIVNSKINTLPLLPKTLAELKVNDSNLSELEYLLPDNLIYLTLSSNNIKNIKLDNLIQLEELDVSNNEINELNFKGLDKLTHLYCNNNQISTLDNLPKSLLYLNCNSNPLKYISFKNLIHNFYLSYCGELDYLIPNIKINLTDNDYKILINDYDKIIDSNNEYQNYIQYNIDQYISTLKNNKVKVREERIDIKDMYTKSLFDPDTKYIFYGNIDEIKINRFDLMKCIEIENDNVDFSDVDAKKFTIQSLSIKKLPNLPKTLELLSLPNITTDQFTQIPYKGKLPKYIRLYDGGITGMDYIKN